MRFLLVIGSAVLVVAACNAVDYNAAGPCGSTGAGVIITATDQDVFSVANVTITHGESVCWQNTGTVSHTVTSNDNVSFNDASLAPGQDFVHAFPAPGSYPYHCSIHPGMAGVITVN